MIYNLPLNRNVFLYLNWILISQTPIFTSKCSYVKTQHKTPDCLSEILKVSTFWYRYWCFTVKNLWGGKFVQNIDAINAFYKWFRVKTLPSYILLSKSIFCMHLFDICPQIEQIKHYYSSSAVGVKQQSHYSLFRKCPVYQYRRKLSLQPYYSSESEELWIFYGEVFTVEHRMQNIKYSKRGI